MKKGIRTLLVGAALAALFCVSALADGPVVPTTDGIYDPDPKSDAVTLKILPQSGTNEAEKTTNVQVGANEEDKTDNFYANACRIEITRTDLTSGNQYVLYVIKDGESGGAPITASNLYYIWQDAAAADGSITFTAYPKTMSEGTYKFYIVGADKAFDAAKPDATIKYFKYVPPYVLGDPNEDGTVDSEDALCALKYFVGTINPTSEQELAANVNGDNVVDSEDALAMLKYFVGTIKSFEEVMKG